MLGRDDLLCKLDLEKAYDHVNLNFLDYVLERMGFGIKWRSRIFFCVRTVNYSILVNGSLAGFFKSLRGLRQGDPLLPFLFIMVSEILSNMLRKAEADFISGFLIENGRCRVSHLQFADDTMIFCDADIGQIGYLRCILNCFEVVSGMHVNMAKSELFQVGEGCDVESLAWILGCKIGVLPTTYLGLPLGAPYKSKAMWDLVINRISSLLDSWKAA